MALLYTMRSFVHVHGSKLDRAVLSGGTYARGKSVSLRDLLHYLGRIIRLLRKCFEFERKQFEQQRRRQSISGSALEVHARIDQLRYGANRIRAAGRQHFTNRDALAVGEPAAEWTGARSDRGACARREADRREPAQRRSP